MSRYPPPRAQSSRASWALQAACVLAYLGLCIATGSVWEPSHDEGVAWRQAVGHLWLPAVEAPAPVAKLYASLDGETARSAEDVLDALMIRGGLHPPAYYLMLHWWTGWVGTERLALNVPAYLFGVLSLFGIHRLTRRLVPVRLPPDGSQAWAPLWAMGLLALSPWFVGFSNLAKPYAICVCLFLWSSNALLAIHDDPLHVRRWRSVFVGLSVLGLYCVYHYAFVVAWQGLLALVLAGSRPQRSRELGWVVAMGAAIALGFAPWIPRLLQHLELSGASRQYFSGSVPPLEWPGLALGMFRIFALGEGLRAIGNAAFRSGWGLLAFATLPLVLLSFTRHAGSRLGGQDLVAKLFWASGFGLPLVTLLGDAWRGTHTVFISKLSFPLLPLMLIAIVRGWQVPPAAFRSAGLAAWALLFAMASTSNVYTRAISITPFEAVAHYLKTEDSPSHLLVVSSKAQGYLIPQLLAARDAGVRELRVGFAPQERLEGVLEKAANDPDISRVTLLNFAVTYRPQDMWRAERLHRLRAHAEGAGWRVGVLDPGSGLNNRAFPKPKWSRESLRNPGKTLVLSELVNVKYYSMEVAGNPGAIKARP